MSTDHEDLRMAAKAAGIQIVCPVERLVVQPRHYAGGFVVRTKTGGDACWNPLTDDGDALRLAVKLQLTICNEHLTAGAAYCTAGLNRTGPSVDARWPQQQTVVDGDYAATRRAIVLAAAEVGRAMP